MRSTTRGTGRRRLRAAAVLRREKGMGAVWRRALVLAGFRTMTLLESRLDPPPDAWALPADLRLDFLSVDQLDAFVAFRQGVGRDEALERLETGSRCFAGWVGAEIVWAHWVAPPVPQVFASFGLTLLFRDGDVYGYDVYTAPAYRGRGISPAASRKLKRFLADEGERRYVSAVLGDNESGLRAARKAGEVPFAHVVAVKLGRLPLVRLTRAPGPSA